MIEQEECNRCGEKLKPGSEVWLELVEGGNIYTDPDKVTIPEINSQGCFAKPIALRHLFRQRKSWLESVRPVSRSGSLE